MEKRTFEEITEKIREDLLGEFDELKKLKDSGDLTESDLDFYLARDRKAGIVLKTLDMDLKNTVMKIRGGQNAVANKQKQIRG